MSTEIWWCSSFVFFFPFYLLCCGRQRRQLSKATIINDEVLFSSPLRLFSYESIIFCGISNVNQSVYISILPFFFLFFLCVDAEALCSTCNIPSPLFSCCFWLGYCNSCLNPFIYASTSREFKRAFSKILCGRRGRSQQSSAGRNVNHQQTVPTTSHFHRHSNVNNSSRNPSVENVSPTATQQLAGGIKTKAQVSATAVGAVDQCASILPDH